MAQFCVKGPQKGPPRCTLYGTLLCSVHLQSWFCGEGVWLESVYSMLCYSRDRHLRFVERYRTRFVKRVTYGIYRWSRHTESGDSLVLLDYDLFDQLCIYCVTTCHLNDPSGFSLGRGDGCSGSPWRDVNFVEIAR